MPAPKDLKKRKEWIKKLQDFNRGKPGYWLGKKRSKEDREKMSKAKKGYHPKSEFKKGHIPWNKGKRTGIMPKSVWKKGQTHFLNGKKIGYHRKGKSAWNKGLKGKLNSLYGRKHSKETRRKISEARKGNSLSKEHKNNLSLAHKGVKLDKNHRKRIREGSIKRIERTRLQGLPLTPCIGKHEKTVLDNLEKCFNYKIKRQFKVSGYFIDGYCPNLNLAIEIDEPHHKYKEDMLRQNEIEEVLNCNFLRIEVPI